MKIRCSGLARPMVCAGYSFLDLHEGSTNPAAEAGTACGEYLEHLLTGRPEIAAASNGVYIDDDMKFFTKPIFEDVMDRTSEDISCEHEINWMTRAQIEIAGHPDMCFEDKQGVLCIEDLKYGFGIVEVKENWQLLGYAIGEVIRRGKAYDFISLKIHQPRAHHEDGSTREWRLTYSELLEYKEMIEDRMESIANGNKTLQTSDQCKYCKGAAQACPAFNRVFHRALEVSTEFFQDSITNEELSAQLDQIKRSKEAIKIKEDSLIELSIIKIKQGEIIPNYVQQQTYGNRSWKSSISPESIEMMTGINVIEKKFMTPSKAEKLGVSKDLVKQLTEKKFTGNKLIKGNTTEIGNNIFGNTKPQGEN